MTNNSGQTAVIDNVELLFPDPGQCAADSGLDYSLNPNYGETSLNAGFMPDPFEVSVISGGEVDVAAFNYGDFCYGFATRQPDYRR